MEETKFALDWVQALGFLAAFLMFTTFYMKNMIPLRIIGITSNFTFVLYAINSDPIVWPLLILHALLLPMNSLRLHQMLKMVQQVRHASEGDISFEFLLHQMESEKYSAGDVIFHKGDNADKIYLVKSGTVLVDELNVTIEPGELFGEMGVFSREHTRLATLSCVTDAEVLSMTDKQIREHYYQNPEFGFYLIQLLLKRFSHEGADALKVALADRVTG